MAVIAPIQGNTPITVGSVTTFTNATVGGVWSSTNNAIATVDPASGAVTAIALGNVQIVYTVGADSTAINLTVQAVSSLTNGLNFNLVYNALKNRVLWNSQGLVSDSNQYFEDFHPLNDTFLLTAALPNNITLQQYLANEQRAVIMDMLNAVYSHKEMIDHAKLAFFRDDTPLPFQLVQNVPGGWAGLKFFIAKGDHAVKINSLILFFTENVSFNLYLYNDFFLAPVLTIPVTASAYQECIIDMQEKIILNNLVPTAYKAGRWYLTYKMNDLGTAQAIYYPVNKESFHPVNIEAFSAPTWIDPSGNVNFNRINIGANNLMYGLNAEISTFIDGTNNIVQNVSLFDKLIGLMQSVRNVNRLIFAYNSNATQRVAQGNMELGKLYAELNGFKAEEDIPYVLGLKDKVNAEVKRVKQSFQKRKTLAIGTQ